MPTTHEAALEARLENWGRWNRNGSGGGRCGSAEGRYVPPRDEEGERAERLARLPVDGPDAEAIEEAVCSLRIRRARVLLKRVYVLRHDKLVLARWLNVPPLLVRPAVLMAQGALQARLDHAPMARRDAMALRRGLQAVSGSGSVGPLSNVVLPEPCSGEA